MTTETPIPEMIAVFMLEPSAGSHLLARAEVIQVIPVIAGPEMWRQMSRAISPWMERTDNAIHRRMDDGRSLVEIRTSDGETTDIICLEVPPERRREVLYRWRTRIGSQPAPSWEEFDDIAALTWWELAEKLA